MTFFVFLGTYLAMESDTSPHINPDPYPVTDAEGYFQSYQEGGTWINWWTRDKPGHLGTFAQFLFNSDRSGVPYDDEAELNRTLPVHLPYFSPRAVGDVTPSNGLVRATWIGHSTVVAEVDSAVLITDPMFSEYASPLSGVGEKR